MRKLFWEILARLGFWIPCNKYLPHHKYWDWVLISYCDNINGFRGVPSVAYVTKLNNWQTIDETISYYVNNNCTVTHWHRLPRKIKDK